MKKNRLIAVLGILCVISLSVMGLVLCRDGAEQTFTPPPFEEAAQTGMPDGTQLRGYQELDTGAFRVGLCGEVKTEDGTAEVWFANPRDNAVWMKLRILDGDGKLLGQTGLLRPGEYVRQVLVAETVPGMDIELKVMAYEPETYHSAGALLLHGCIVAE